MKIDVCFDVYVYTDYMIPINLFVFNIFDFFVGIVSADRAGWIVIRANNHIYIPEGMYVCMYVCI